MRGKTTQTKIVIFLELKVATQAPGRGKTFCLSVYTTGHELDLNLGQLLLTIFVQRWFFWLKRYEDQWMVKWACPHTGSDRGGCL